MDIELLEIRDFLASRAPFDLLPEAVLEQLPRLLVIRYLRRGTEFPPEDESAPALYIVRQGAVELRDSQGNLFEKLAEGDLYATLCGDETDALHLQGVTAEDSLLYLLPCERFERLRRGHAEFNAHFTNSLHSRLRHALEQLQASTGQQGPAPVEVGQLVGRHAISAPSGIPIREAAQLMTAEQTSSLLLTEGDKLVGMVTDRDLRSRCLAEGLDSNEPVSHVMTARLHTISHRTLASEALLIMSRHNIHHLPVLDHGRLIGVISSNDVLRQQSSSAIHLVGAVHRAKGLGELIDCGRQLPELQRQLINAGTSPFHLGQILTSVGDAITRRLLELAEKKLGAAPIAYAWLAVGSQARHELTAHSDQDNALLLDDDYDEPAHGEYFAEMAQFVTDGLNACGFYYCPGKVMASNPEWRQPQSVWRRYFEHWIGTPERKALMLACNFFDMRVVGGEHSLFENLHRELLEKVRNNRIFLAHLAANALHNTPPLGFFRQFVLIHDGEHDHSFDLKLRGVMPITDLARLFALSNGLPELNTFERLKAAAATSALSKNGAADLTDALELIAMVRLRHQVHQHLHGLEMDNYLNPEELSQLERSHLKDAFAAIRTIQNAVAQRYQSGRFY